jgi:hypothetical protein
MKTISLTLSKTLDAKLASAAKQRETTKSAIVRAAFKHYLARHPEPPPESLAALAKDLIGCVSGGPNDLSYNKKYLEGLGRSEKSDQGPSR